MQLFISNERVRQLLRRPQPGEQSIKADSSGETFVLINVPDARLELLSPVVHLILGQTLHALSERPLDRTDPVLLEIDEFAAFGRLNIVPTLRKIRKRHVRVMICTQALADLDKVYGIEDRLSILSNTAYKVILGISDRDTQRVVSDMIGSKRQTALDAVKEMLLPDYRYDPNQRAIEPSDLGRLGDKLLLLHPGGYEKLTKNYYFKK